MNVQYFPTLKQIETTKRIVAENPPTDKVPTFLALDPEFKADTELIETIFYSSPLTVCIVTSIDTIHTSFTNWLDNIPGTNNKIRIIFSCHGVPEFAPITKTLNSIIKQIPQQKIPKDIDFNKDPKEILNDIDRLISSSQNDAIEAILSILNVYDYNTIENDRSIKIGQESISLNEHIIGPLQEKQIFTNNQVDFISDCCFSFKWVETLHNEKYRLNYYFPTFTYAVPDVNEYMDAITLKPNQMYCSFQNCKCERKVGDLKTTLCNSCKHLTRFHSHQRYEYSYYNAKNQSFAFSKMFENKGTVFFRLI